jgi:hypothetical protein
MINVGMGWAFQRPAGRPRTFNRRVSCRLPERDWEVPESVANDVGALLPPGVEVLDPGRRLDVQDELAPVGEFVGEADRRVLTGGSFVMLHGGVVVEADDERRAGAFFDEAVGEGGSAGSAGVGGAEERDCGKTAVRCGKGVGEPFADDRQPGLGWPVEDEVGEFRVGSEVLGWLVIAPALAGTEVADLVVDGVEVCGPQHWEDDAWSGAGESFWARELAWSGVEADPVGGEELVGEAPFVQVAERAGADGLPEEIGSSADQLADRWANRRRL